MSAPRRPYRTFPSDTASPPSSSKPPSTPSASTPTTKPGTSPRRNSKTSIGTLRDRAALGANVTIPYKEAASRYVERLHETARFVGAINTIVNEGGHLAGYNTDVAGFQAALKETGFDPKGAHIVIWGAGGAARAVAWALIWRRAAALTIVNRTAVRAGRLRHDIAAAITGGKPDGVRLRSAASDAPEALDALRTCDLIVQCTPVGMHGTRNPDVLPFPVDALNPSAMVVDLIANPAETPLLQQARAAGHRVLGGQPMLVPPGRRLLRTLDPACAAHGGHARRCPRRPRRHGSRPLMSGPPLSSGGRHECPGRRLS